MKTERICGLVSLLACVVGCASSPPKANPPPAVLIQKTLASVSGDLRVGHPMDGVARDWGTYVLIRKNGDSWQIVSIESASSAGASLVNPKNRTARDGELLFLSEDLKYVSVEFSPLETSSLEQAKAGRFICFVFGFDELKKKDFRPNACNSDLTSSVEKLSNAAKQAAGAIVTLGITTVAANSVRSVDAVKVVAAMESARVIPRVKYYRYTKEFSAAQSSEQLQAFINRYRNDDPDGLVTKAESSFGARVEQERIESERRVLEAELARQRQEREAERAQQERSRRDEQARERAAQFRQSLQPGDQSHCGLVIEVKKPLVKLQTMIGEYWMRIEQVYPAGNHDCRFINGQYIY